MRTFRQALQERLFTVSAELGFQSETTVDEVLRQAELLSGVVDGFQVAENPQAYMQTSVVALAALLKQRGLDPVPQLSCRDRNRIALQSDLLGLRALGVTSVLLNKGARLPVEDETVAAPVFDLNARELVAMAQELNDEAENTARELLIGTDATVCAPGPRWSPDPLLGRAAVGARFLQTQPCFNVKMLRKYMKRLVEDKVTWQFAVIVTLAPLPSAETAAWLQENIRGALIPPALVERLQHADDPEQEGIDICAELIREIAAIPGISGINLLTLGNPPAVKAAIESSGVRNREESK